MVASCCFAVAVHRSHSCGDRSGRGEGTMVIQVPGSTGVADLCLLGLKLLPRAAAGPCGPSHVGGVRGSNRGSWYLKPTDISPYLGSSTMGCKRAFLTAIVAICLACTGERTERTADQPITVADVGFRTPESVLHDAAADVYLVSNIDGSPLALDGNGFVSRLAPNGSVLALRWIDGGADGVTLNAPKGMAIRRDTLFVADITAVRLFDRTTGAALGSWEVSGATFLNDLVVDFQNVLYVSDTGVKAGAQGFEPSGTDAVYRFNDAMPERLTAGPALGGPNGLAAASGRLILVTFGSGAIVHIDPSSGQTSGFPTPPAGQLDGVVVVDGSLLVSSWEGKAVYRVGSGAQYSTVVDGVEAPADIGYDRKRQRVLIPLFTTDRVLIFPLR